MPRTRFWALAPTLGLCLGLGTAHAAAASPATVPGLLPRVRRDLRAPFSEDGALRLGGGALLALAAKSVENADRQEKLLDQGLVDGASDLGNVVGSGQFVGGAALALDVGGVLLQRPAVLDLGLDLTSTFAVGGAYTWALKTLVRRRRPSGGPFSFPSGHTCSAFAAATVVQRHLGWRVGALAYALAAGTAAGRLEDRRHYLSDVTFGAALGLAVASAVHPEGRAGWTARHLRPSPTGLTLSWGF